MQEVVRQLSERMAAAGHVVTVVTRGHADRSEKTQNGVHIREFDIAGNAVVGLQGEVAAYETFLQVESESFDVMVFFAAQQWAADIALPLLDRIHTQKVFVPTGFSQLYHPEYAGYYEEMKTWIRSMDHCVFLSNEYRDIQFARQHGVVNLSVIPNGAAEEEFDGPCQVDVRKLLGIPSEHFLILHVGSFVTTKGQLDAVRMFFRSGVRPATLLLVGNKKEQFKGLLIRHPLLWLKFQMARRSRTRKVIYTSLERRETVAAYRAADLFLFPSMIECSPIVLFEAMASHTPFLSTDVGNAKEIAAWSSGGWIMPTRVGSDGFCRAVIPESAKLLLNLSLDTERRKTAGENGYRAWKERFTWGRIAQQYIDLYTDLRDKT